MMGFLSAGSHMTTTQTCVLRWHKEPKHLLGRREMMNSLASREMMNSRASREMMNSLASFSWNTGQEAPHGKPGTIERKGLWEGQESRREK
jgi:hypothetical protein